MVSYCALITLKLCLNYEVYSFSGAIRSPMTVLGEKHCIYSLYCIFSLTNFGIYHILQSLNLRLFKNYCLVSL